ncbi:Gfo/Idh/MocA family oxidoreductase [Planctomyces sp. SH-PL14]|uniref:Gfo/Idh/MocA family oxidoreductase n=1 Tax=Planctomyces sp. SH-PL14 TaxID=1632864 RepID=UPI00078C9A43|nr:Gfo/Idh/MocA family oxidoreductase [Planctomyces sp. SH-PL14]AMV22552.1 putative oxidoreductase [Planctomyces sp. SH-PL14]
MASSRRRFLQTTAAIGAGVFVGKNRSFGEDSKSPNEKVQYACIGIGGKGDSDSKDAAAHGTIVAFCDVDSDRREARIKVPGFEAAQRFADYREMLDKLGDKIDAVTVSTPDHHHAPAAAMAMKMGKACFCQKPLTHTVWEARKLAKIAEEKKLATQMGNQGTSEPALRKAAALLKKDFIGAIKEVHVITNRPVWAQGGPRPPKAEVPKNLDWDLWLGPAPERDYGPGYHPFAWRGWWDFGTGALGDMACHTFNLPFAGVGLANPTSIQAWTTGHNRDSYPQKSKIRFEFKKGDNIVPVWWYDGGNKPDYQPMLGDYKFKGNSGAIIVGEKYTLYSAGDYGGEFVVLDKGKPVDLPDVEWEKSPGHFTEFHETILGKRASAMSNFANYAGPLTETILLGNLAVFAAAEGESPKIEWNAEKLEAVGHPELQKIVNKEYRGQWGAPLA